LQNEPWLTKDASSGGAGFNSQWDVSFHGALKDAVTPPGDEPRNMVAVADAIQRNYNGSAFQRVIHSESHDEVHVSQGRMPEKIWWGYPDSYVAKKRSILAAAIVFTSTGIPVIFQGQEFLEWGSWSDNLGKSLNAILDWSKQ
jgi:1,4-alpha-glucan branching enzyme